MPKKQNSTRKQFRGMKMVIGRKSKKNNIKPKQYKKSKRYGKSKRYNKTQRGGAGERWRHAMVGVMGTLNNNFNSMKEKAQSALNAKKEAMKGFITENQSKINVEKTKTKILEKLNAAKDKINNLIGKLENDDENIDDTVVNDGAEFIEPEDIALNEGPNEGPNKELPN